MSGGGHEGKKDVTKTSYMHDDGRRTRSGHMTTESYTTGGGHEAPPPKDRKPWFTWIVAGIALAGAGAAVLLSREKGDGTAQVEAAGDTSDTDTSRNVDSSQTDNKPAGASAETAGTRTVQETHTYGFSDDLLTTVHVDLPTGAGFRVMLLIAGPEFAEMRVCGDDETACSLLETAAQEHGAGVGGIASAGSVSGEDDGINFPIPRSITIDGVVHPVVGGRTWVKVIPDGGGAARTIAIPANPGEQVGDPE